MGDYTSLALDLGSTIGWALGKSGVIQASGEVTLSAKGSHPGHRWMKFQEWLHKYHKVDELMFEDVVAPFSSNAAAKVYGALLGQLQVFSLAHGIRMLSLKPTQVKKDFTGMGNSKKNVMCEVAMNLGWKNGVRGTENNHNECDAIALLWVIYSRKGIEPSFLKQEMLSISQLDPLRDLVVP